jgi:glutaredoxin
MRTHIIHIDMMHKHKYNDKQSQGHSNSLTVPHININGKIIKRNFQIYD